MVLFSHIKTLRSGIIFGFVFLFYVGHAQNGFQNWQKNLDQLYSDNEKVVFLDSLTKEMIRVGAPEQIKAIEKYIEINITHNNFDKAAQKSRFLIQYFSSHGEYNKAWKLLNDMFLFSDKFRQEKTKAHLLLKRGGLNYMKGDLQASIGDYEQAAPIFFKTKDSIYAADTYYFTAQAYHDLGEPVESIQFITKAYELYNSLGDVEYALKVKFEMSDFFRENGMINRAMIIWRELLLESKQQNLPCLQVWAGWYLLKENSKALNEKQFAEALQKLQQINKTCDNIQEAKRFKVFIDWLGVHYYADNNNARKADSLHGNINYHKAAETSPYEKGLFLTSEAKYLSAKGETSDAITLLATYLNSNKSTSTIHRIEILEQLVELTKKLHRNEDIIAYSQELLTLKDSLYKVSIAHNYALNQANFELDQKESQIKKGKVVIESLIKETSGLKSRTFLIVGIISFILMLLVGAIVSYKRRVKKQMLKNNILANQIDEKTEELDLLVEDTLKELKKKEVLKERLQELSEGGDKVSVQRIITDLKWSKSDDEKKTVVVKNLKELSYNFNKRLKSTYPNLTKTELEIIGFIKLGMNRKEIAQIRNTTIEAVKKSRTRIKKKLDLAKNQNIDDFIKQF